MKPSLVTALAGAAILFAPATAFAQWIPGSEITGQQIQVTAVGITNPVYFDPGGQARIVTPKGRILPATWVAANQSLCLTLAAARECWPYTQPFQAGQAVNLTSDASVTSHWVPMGTNPISAGSGMGAAPPPPPAPPAPGERG